MQTYCAANDYECIKHAFIQFGIVGMILLIGFVIFYWWANNRGR